MIHYICLQNQPHSVFFSRMETTIFFEATKSDLIWVNEQYASIGFKTSNLDNEVIVIASIDGRNAGVGRLVKIDEETAELGGMYVLPNFRKKKIAGQLVQELLKRRNSFRRIFCLPFSHLENFYKRFGFRNLSNAELLQMPKEISEKLSWCARTYKDSTSILVM